MKHDQQVSQLRELLAGIRDHKVPDAGKILECPMTEFTDPELAARERQTLFHDHPQMIGLSGELDGPDSFLALNDFGVPVLATRDKSGVFRAFVNACRHRGVQVTQATRGRQKLFVCPYHAWTYATDGRLVKVREEDLFGAIDKSCNGLIELPAVEKYGMLWVHPRRDGVLDVDALLGSDLAEEFASWELERSVFRGELTIERELNWKLASDTFCEAYHFGVLHSKTVANVVHGDYNTYKSFGANHRMVVPNRSINSVEAQVESRWRLAPLASIAYYVFPNVHIILNGNVLSVTRIFPDAGSPTRSVSRISVFQTDHLLGDATGSAEVTALSRENIYSANATKPVALDVGALIELFDTTVDQEDYKVACQIQISASSGMIDAVKFGRNEPGVQHAHNAIRAALNMPPLGEYRGVAA